MVKVYKFKRTLRRRYARKRKSPYASGSAGIIQKMTLPRKVSSVMGKIVKFTMTQEFAVSVVTGSVSAGATASGIYTFGTGTYASPVVSLNLLLSQSSAAIGSSGYSGKWRVAIEQYQYMKIKGFRLTYTNTIPSGGENLNAVVPTIGRLSDIAFTMLPADLSGYSGAVANLTTDTIVPSDIYEYDNTLKVQPNNALGKGVSKYFTLPKEFIQGRDISAVSGLCSNNTWMFTKNYYQTDWNLVMGWDSYPQIFNGTSSTAGTVGVVCGTLTVETLIELAIPIKNQSI